MLAPQAFDTPRAIFDPETNRDPSPVFARLCRERPVSRVGETGVHLVASWELVDEVLSREADFSANLTGTLIRDAAGEPALFEFEVAPAMQVIATADEPDHRVHRALVQSRLGAERVAALESRVRAWTREALAPWLAAGGGDWVPIAETVPARAVASILGLPDGDVQRHRQWAMMGGDMLAGSVTPERMAVLAAETGRMHAYLEHHIEQAASSAPDEAGVALLRALGAGVERGEIELAQAVGISVVLFGAGGESTAGLLGSVAHILAERPALAEALRRDPAAIPRFVEEVVRLEPPFKMHYRAVRRPCSLGGCELAAGDRLMLLWGAANRDPAEFEDPDALRLDRRHPKHHMGFGRGRHFCVGAPLARLEARVVVEELLASTSRIAPRAGAGPVYTESLFVRRLEELPLAVERAA